MSAVVAERALEFYGDDGVGAGAIRVYAPQFDARLVDICQFELVWPGFEQRRTIFSKDSWSVLFGACVAASRIIAETPDFVAGRIGMLGQRPRTVEQLEELMGLGSPEQ